MRLSESGLPEVREITRIEFEPLGNGSFRWNVFAGDVRVHSEVSGRETLALIFQTTAILCTCPDLEENDDAAT